MSIKKLLNHTVVRYLLFGGLTTLISLASYFILRENLSISIPVSTALSWITATLFAYLTNRTYVFTVSSNSSVLGWVELISFYSSRLFTGGVELLIMVIFVQWLNLNEVFFKLFTNVLTIILNFILSKYVVFKSKT
jgi:putative flippase GtrA